MLTGKTKSGFQFEVAEENLSNYELIEVLAEVDANPLLLPKTIKLLLGKEQSDRLKEHCRNENGIVPLEKLSGEIEEVFNSQKEIKNS